MLFIGSSSRLLTSEVGCAYSCVGFVNCLTAPKPERADVIVLTRRLIVLFSFAACWVPAGEAIAGQPGYAWKAGDVFLGIAPGFVQVRNQAGVLQETLSTGRTDRTNFMPGCAFAPDRSLYVTELYLNNVSRFAGPLPPHTNTLFGSGYSFPTSVVFGPDGKVYVGNGFNGILQFAADGTFIKSVITTRVDSFDIAADNDTIRYTQQTQDIKTVSISSGLSGPNFSTGTATLAVQIRNLPDGGALLSDFALYGNSEIKRYNASGAVVATYDVSGEPEAWYALALDPDGSSFWAGNSRSSNYYKFNLTSTGLNSHIAGPISTGMGASTLMSICVLGGSPGETSPTSVEQCKDDGWKDFTNPPFKNQGDCIQYVNTGK